MSETVTIPAYHNQPFKRIARVIQDMPYMAEFRAGLITVAEYERLTYKPYEPRKELRSGKH